jgi:hypothetical protein
MTRSLSHLSYALQAIISRYFPSQNVSIFLSRFCKKKFLVSRFRFCQKILSADFCRQQIFFLSADSISKFLSSADFFFVSKCLCRRHLNDAHAGIVRIVPASFLTEKFLPSAGAHFRFYHNSIRFAGPSSGRFIRTIVRSSYIVCYCNVA